MGQGGVCGPEEGPSLPTALQTWLKQPLGAGCRLSWMFLSGYGAQGML